MIESSWICIAWQSNAIAPIPWVVPFDLTVWQIMTDTTNGFALWLDISMPYPAGSQIIYAPLLLICGKTTTPVVMPVNMQLRKGQTVYLAQSTLAAQNLTLWVQPELASATAPA